MADLTDVYAALQKADAAGDSAGAKQLADYIRSQPTQRYGSGKSYDVQADGSLAPTGSPQALAAQSPVAGQSFAQNFSAGVGKSFVDTGHGLRQLATEAGGLVGAVPQQQVDALRQQESARAVQDRPLMQSAGGLTGDIAGQMAQFSAPAGMIPRAAAFLPRLAAAAGTGAAIANTQPVTADQSRLGNTAAGAAGGAAGEVAASGLARVAAPSPKVTPEVAALAQKAQEMGIPLRAEQVTGSRPMAGVSAAMDAIPLSGRDASRQAQRSAFNTAVAKTFGQAGDNLTTAVRQGEQQLGAKYDAVLKSYPVTADAQLGTDLRGVLDQARNELSDQQFGVIERQVNNIVGKVTNPPGASAGTALTTPGAAQATPHVIDGQAAYNIKKTLDRLGNSQDSSLAYHAREVRSALMDALDRSLPPDVAKDFAQTRAQYGNLMSVRRLLKAGADGGITPAALGNAKRVRGDLKDVADVGAQFLKEPFGNSGTANRLIGANLLGGAGMAAYFEPTTLAASLGTMGAARGANTLMQSQPMVNYLLKGSPALQRGLPYVNGLLPVLGATGAITGQ